MIQLQGLLHSLTAMMIRYHDHNQRTQDNKMVKKSNTIPDAKEYSLFLLNKTNDEVQDILCTLIERTSERKHLLTYIQNEIMYLKNMLDNKVPVAEVDFEQQKNHIIQTLMDLKVLASKPKTKQHQVNGIALDGVNACYSGDLLNMVLTDMELSPSSTDKMIRDVVDFACTNHQNALKAAEFQSKIKELNTALDDEKRKFAELNLKFEEEKSKNTDLSMRLTVSISEQTNQQLRIREAQDEISELKKHHREKKNQPIPTESETIPPLMYTPVYTGVPSSTFNPRIFNPNKVNPKSDGTNNTNLNYQYR